MKLTVSALLCAGLALLSILAPNYVALADSPASATDVPFPDVPENSFAYDAIRQLAADGFLAGYPDGTFKGDRPMSRYEVSYLINKIVNAMKDQIANGKTPPPDDVALINKRAASVSSDLKDLSGRVDAMKKEEAALKTEADVSRDNLRGIQ